MRKLLFGLLLTIPAVTFGANGTVTIIDKLAPQNGAFQGLVDSSQTVTNVTNFNNNLTSAETDVQKALDKLDDISLVGSGDAVKSSTQTWSAPNTYLNATTSPAIKIIQTGNVGTSDGTGGAFVVEVTSQTGNGIQVFTSRLNGTQLTGLINLRSNTTSYDEPMLYINSESSGTVGANADIRIDANNPDIEFVETDQTAPAGKFEIAVQSDVLQFNSRNTANNAFQQRISMNHSGALRFKENDNGGDFIGFIAADTMSGSQVYQLPLPTGTNGQGWVLNNSTFIWVTPIVSTNSLQSGTTIYLASGTISNFNVGTLKFSDGTTMTTAASGSGGSGSSVYNATATAGFPYGFSASSVTISAQAVFQNVSTTTFQGVSAMTFEYGSALTMSTGTTLTLPSGQALTETSSVTTQGVITAGTNVSLSQTAGVLTISASGGGGGGGSSSLAVGTGSSTNFTSNVTSPTAAISFLNSQFSSASGGTTNFVSLNGSSVTLYGTSVGRLSGVTQSWSSTNTFTAGTTMTSNSASTAVPLTVNSQNTTANKNGIRINSSGNGTGMYINQSGSTPDVVDQGALAINNSGNIGFGESIYTSRGADQRNPLFQMQADNQAFGTYFMMLSNAATNYFSTTIEMQAPIPSIEFRGLPLSQAPVDEFQISERLDELRFEGRKQDNTGFDSIMVLQRPTTGAPTSSGLVLIEKGGYHNPINPLDVAGEVAIGRSYAKVSTAPTNGLIVQGRVGISTTSPVNTLAVAGGAVFTSSVTIGGNEILSGNLGIGTATPPYPLSVVGTGLFTGDVLGTGFSGATAVFTSTVSAYHVRVVGTITTSTDTVNPVPVLSSCGSSPSISAGATDTSGKIAVGGGTVTSCTMTFGKTWGKEPACTISGNAGTVVINAVTSTSALTITGASTFNGATLMYNCLGNE